MAAIRQQPVIEPKTAPERILLKPEEGAHAINVSRAQIYKYMAEGRIKSIKIGRSRRIPVAELQRWIAEEVEKQSI